MRLFTFAVLCVLLFAPCATAQEGQHNPETTTQVPALSNFHTVIYEIWHGAWPKKDVKHLQELLPKVETGVKDIASATLPGILRERKDAWDAEVKSLEAAAESYRTAVDKKQSKELLDAAEKLHMQYEKLVRTIRPALKELEEFHTDLYMLYHYYMPGDSIAAMQQSALALKEKMVSLNQAELPARMKEKEQSFIAARKDLSEAVQAFAAVAPKGDVKELHKAVGVVHEKYQKLDDLLSK